MIHNGFFRRFAEFVAAVMIAVFIFAGSAFADIEGEGSSNTLFGLGAGNIVGDDDDANTFIGYRAGYNTADGALAGEGKYNTFLGYQSGFYNTTGHYNTFIGLSSGYNNTAGSSNTFIGRESGVSNTTGSGNVFIGYAAGSLETGSNKLYIDNSNTATPLIYGEFNNNIVTVNGNLGIGTTTPQTSLDTGGGDITVNGADTSGRPRGEEARPLNA